MYSLCAVGRIGLHRKIKNWICHQWFRTRTSRVFQRHKSLQILLKKNLTFLGKCPERSSLWRCNTLNPNRNHSWQNRFLHRDTPQCAVLHIIVLCIVAVMSIWEVWVWSTNEMKAKTNGRIYSWLCFPQKIRKFANFQVLCINLWKEYK